MVEPEKTDKGDVITVYTILTQFFLLMFNYKAMRNLSSFSVWFIIGITHLFFFYHFKAHYWFTGSWQLKTTGLRNTVPLLIIYQIARFVSVKIQQQEFVIPSKGSRRDIFEERTVNFLDVLLFIFLMASMVILWFWN